MTSSIFSTSKNTFPYISATECFKLMSWSAKIDWEPLIKIVGIISILVSLGFTSPYFPMHLRPDLVFQDGRNLETRLNLYFGESPYDGFAEAFGHYTYPMIEFGVGTNGMAGGIGVMQDFGAFWFIDYPASTIASSIEIKIQNKTSLFDYTAGSIRNRNYFGGRFNFYLLFFVFDFEYLKPINGGSRAETTLGLGFSLHFPIWGRL